MKKYILALIVLFVMGSTAFAIDNEELQQARVILAQMSQAVSKLSQYVALARQDQIDNMIILTPEQKQYLKNKYINEKTELVDLYNQLP